MTKRPIYTLDNCLKKVNLNPHRLSHKGYLYICICLFLSSLLLACASTPPSKTLPQSKVAVSSVDHTNYRKHVSGDVDTVKAKLKQAQDLEADKQHATVEQLAQQILVDVELIRIKTQRLNVEQEVKKIESSISNLHDELNWREPVQLSPLNQ
ncbi:MAG: DUF4398 domain-containing protein [Gammaproteobacteria bacterium]|nr:MAG: DUF4398 domain-containing protein [Gammaproteobacteria bacterium]